jgi:hypothetical protein
MDSMTFLQYGGITFDELKAMANHTILGPAPPSTSQTTVRPAPTLNADGTCKTSDPYNWGSSNPAHACYNYFPIILVGRNVGVKGTAAGSYGQALIIMDLVDGKGAEFELEPAAGELLTFAGLMVGFGCPEIEDGAKMYGAGFGDAVTAPIICGGDQAFRVGSGGIGTMSWSSCVTQMVLERTGVAAASGGIPAAGAKRFTRGFLTTLR